MSEGELFWGLNSCWLSGELQNDQIFNDFLNKKDVDELRKSRGFLRKLEVLILSYHNFALCQLFQGEPVQTVKKSIKNGTVLSKKYLPGNSEIKTKLISLHYLSTKDIEGFRDRHMAIAKRQHNFSNISLPTDNSAIERREHKAILIRNDIKSNGKSSDRNNVTDDVLLHSPPFKLLLSLFTVLALLKFGRIRPPLTISST